MQQTQKYKLNLIESSDPFLPEGLNQNTRKVEEVLSENLETMRTDLNAVIAGLGTGGKNARVAWGSYVGNGGYGVNSPCSLHFDFTPVLVRVDSYVFSVGQTRAPAGTGFFNSGDVTFHELLTWGENSVSWYCEMTAKGQLNTANTVYYYTAIGYDPATE